MNEDYEITLKPTSVTSRLANFHINNKHQITSDKISNDLSGNLPFPHFYFKDFLSDPSDIELLVAELKATTWNKKENDLYSLQQTRDLKFFDYEKYPNLCLFRRFLKNELTDYLKKITQLDLNENIACTGSRYFQTDTLLPHDDSLDERAIAFILYLSEDFSAEDGGDLVIYESDPTINRPIAEAKRFPPTKNSFFIFPVGTNTWHSVAEVLEDKMRLTLNGWFHMKDRKSAADPTPEASVIRKPPELNVTLEDVNLWFNPTYVDPRAHARIKREFSLRSQLTLDNFLNMSCYDDVLKELEASKYDKLGTIDRRNIERLDESTVPKDSAIQKMLDLFKSEALTLFLTQWTGLKLFQTEEVEEPSTKKPRLEAKVEKNKSVSDVTLVSSVNRLKHGYYSLVDSQMAADAANNGYALDIIMFFMKDQEWPADGGGFICYIAENDPDELLRVPPRKNSLAIVFREPGVLSFTKYVNARAKGQEYYVLNVTYFGLYHEADSEAESSSAEDEEECETEEEDDEEQEVGPVEEEVTLN